MNKILGIGTSIAKSFLVSIRYSLMIVLLIRDNHAVVLKSCSSVFNIISIVKSLVAKFTAFFAQS